MEHRCHELWYSYENEKWFFDDECDNEVTGTVNQYRLVPQPYKEREKQ